MALFDKRASTYDEDAWHLRYAERLVALAGLEPGMRVLDAATGTGHAALAAASVVGPSGQVVGVDISPGMLARARAAATGTTNVELIESDASRLPRFADGSFDRVLCSAGLLYLPVQPALHEWRRLLEPGGLVGFSTMRTGYPVAGKLFRDRARAFGLRLDDPAEHLGEPDRCIAALRDAGFEPLEPVEEILRFSAGDLENAWEAHFHSRHHDAMSTLSESDLEKFRREYTAELAESLDPDAGRLLDARVIYAFGRKASPLSCR